MCFFWKPCAALLAMEHAARQPHKGQGSGETGSGFSLTHSRNLATRPLPPLPCPCGLFLIGGKEEKRNLIMQQVWHGLGLYATGMQELQVLVTGGESLVMFRLMLDVVTHGLQIGGTYGENTVTALPGKGAIITITGFEPLVGCYFWPIY